MYDHKLFVLKQKSKLFKMRRSISDILGNLCLSWIFELISDKTPGAVFGLVI
jgi:hypothetical protein